MQVPDAQGLRVCLTDNEFSCEGPVELAASTTAGPRPSMLFTTAGAGRVR
jgi:hypothetical protein